MADATLTAEKVKARTCKMFPSEGVKVWPWGTVALPPSPFATILVLCIVSAMAEESGAIVPNEFCWSSFPYRESTTEFMVSILWPPLNANIFMGLCLPYTTDLEHRPVLQQLLQYTMDELLTSPVS
jgi:hypothetical protein